MVAWTEYHKMGGSNDTSSFTLLGPEVPGVMLQEAVLLWKALEAGQSVPRVFWLLMAAIFFGFVS